jgi:hypothetical protein
MPKIITGKRRETEADQAREYVKTHILLPSGLLGMIFMVAGAASLVYQFMYESFGWQSFLETTGLLLTGMMAGWAQTRYHRFLLRKYPAHFAGRMKIFSQSSLKRQKRDIQGKSLDHPGRQWIPFGYVIGFGMILGAAASVALYGNLYYVTAFFMPWVGFFWAKMFFWRQVLRPAGA